MIFFKVLCVFVYVNYLQHETDKKVNIYKVDEDDDDYDDENEFYKVFFQFFNERKQEEKKKNYKK